MDLYRSLQVPYIRENVGGVPGITAWKACLVWWWVPSARMVGIRYSGSYWKYYHCFIFTSSFLSISLEAQSLALHWQSGGNPIARGTLYGLCDAVCIGIITVAANPVW